MLISPEELRLPQFVIDDYLEGSGLRYEECRSLEEAMPKLDILYMTRIQRERFTDDAEYQRLNGIYVLDKEKMSLAKSDMCVLHPLPRVNEISPEVDSDPRAKYFEQTRCGKFMRMALIMKLLGSYQTRFSPKRRRSHSIYTTNTIVTTLPASAYASRMSEAFLRLLTQTAARADAFIVTKSESKKVLRCALTERSCIWYTLGTIQMSFLRLTDYCRALQGNRKTLFQPTVWAHLRYILGVCPF